MPPSSPPAPRVHLADPGEASDAARALWAAVVRTLAERPDRQAGFERLRGRVAVRLEDGPAASDVGLVFDRGTLVVWDGPPPGGAHVQLVVPVVLLAGPPTGRRTGAALVGRRLRVDDAVRRPRLVAGTLRLLGIV